MLVAITGLAVWGSTRPAPSRVARFPIPLAADQSFRYGVRLLVAIAPDGTQVVYGAQDGLWQRSVDQLQATHVSGTDEGALGPFFSADGQSIGFHGDGQLKKVSVSGGTPVTITDVADPPYGVSWGANDMILFGQREGIMQVSGAGGTPELLIAANDGEIFHGPQMLPGDEWVLFSVRTDGSWDEGTVVAESRATGERTLLIDGGRDGRYLPTGHLVYGVNGVLLAVPFDVGTLRVSGGPVPLVEGVRAARGPISAGAMQWSVSADGSLVYVLGSAGDDGTVSLAWVGRDGDETGISAEPRPYDSPTVSPDGTQIALEIAGDNRDIWIWNLELQTLTQLTFDEGNDQYPLWTPDSARVVFSSSRDGGGQFWKAADGTGRVEQLLNTPGVLAGSWSADGRLVFSQSPGTSGCSRWTANAR